MFDPPIYDYILFDKQTTVEAFHDRLSETAEANLPQDLVGIRDALNKGYRWVRSDGEFAVFEKALTRPLLQIYPVPSPIHFMSGGHHAN